MFYLVVVILSNVILTALFKLFPKYKVNTFQAIVVNYWTCVITGSICLGKMCINTESFHADWFPWALILGIGFITIFNLIGYSTKIDGITTTTIANKLSLVIPVVLSVILYKEQLNIARICGIAVALPAVYLTSMVKDENHKTQNLFIPILLFFSSGALDSFVKYSEHNFLPTNDVQAAFSINAFATAGVIGTTLIAILVILGKIQLHWRNIIAGICLGIPNYFSIYLFIRLLHSNFLESSASIPITNIGIVVVSTITAIILFKEKLTIPRIIGLLLAIVAIILIAFNGRTI
jgi:drug/metabolite transporter (DMT)-like permease